MENEDTSRSTFFHCFTVFEVRFVESSIVFDPCHFPFILPFPFSSAYLALNIFVPSRLGRSTGRFYFRIFKIK